MFRASLSLHHLAEQYCHERCLNKIYKGNVLRGCLALERFCEGPIEPAALSVELVNEWLASVAARGLKPATVKHYKAAVVCVWHYAADRHLCEPPNCRRLMKPKVRPPIPVAWTQDEVVRLIEAARLIRTTICGVNGADWFEGLIRTAFDSGHRSIDLLSAGPSQISDSGLMTVCQSKTGVVLSRQLQPSTVAVIERTQPGDRPLIWPWPFRREAWQRAVVRLVRQAELTGTFKFLRKSSGSYVESIAPGCGSRHLGHRDANIFDKHYNDTRLTAGNLPMPPELPTV